MPRDELWVDRFGLPALDGVVECTTLWNGSLVVGGQFSQVGGVPASNVAIWDGSQWNSLGSGLNEEVLSLLVYNGALVAGGRFTHSGQVAAAGVARWNGAAWEAMGSGFDLAAYYLPMVNALAIYRNDLIAAGDFTHSGATPLRSVARWDGNLWNPLGAGLNGRALALAAMGDSLYVGGLFDSAGNEGASSLARWDGNGWSAAFGGVTRGGNLGIVYSLAVFRNRLIVGGEFDSAGGHPMRNIADLSGDEWAPLAEGVHARATCLAVHQDSLFVGLWFGSEGVLEWNGATWRWTAPMTYGYPMALLSSGTDLIVGGAFRAESAAENRIAGFNVARWTGETWVGFETWKDTMHGLSSMFGGSPHVQSVEIYRGQITAGGFIGLAGEPPDWMPSGTIVGWDGNHWHDILPQSYFGQAYTLLAAGDTLYAGGSLYAPYPYPFSFGTTPVFRYDGAIWTAMDTLSATGTCLTMFQGSLYLGAQRTGSPGPYRGGLYRWTGDHWQLIGLAESATTFPGVKSMTVHDGMLIVGGTFERIGGVPAMNVAAWDGTSWRPLGNGLEADYNTVGGLAEWNGDLVAGGWFVNLPGGPAGVAIWNGDSWRRLGALNGVAYTIKNFAGQLFAGGWFGSERQHVQGLVQWDGASWTPMGSGVNGPVYSMAQHENSLIVVGSFTLAGGKSSFGIAEWSGLEPTSPAPPIALISMNRPNPFRVTTQFTLDLPHSGIVRVSIHDIAGREVAVLEDGYRTNGSHPLGWDGRDASGRSTGTGMYFIRAALPDGVVLTRKVLRIK